MKSNPRKSAAKPKGEAKTPGERPALVAQPHGGALQIGNPGNAGGTGRPPSAIRQAFRESLDKRLPRLEAIADGKPYIVRSRTETYSKTRQNAKEKLYASRGRKLQTPSISEQLAALDVMRATGMTAPPIEHVDIRTHPDVARFMSAYRQALLLELSQDVADRVSARVESLLLPAPASE